MCRDYKILLVLYKTINTSLKEKNFEFLFKMLNKMTEKNMNNFNFFMDKATIHKKQDVWINAINWPVGQLIALILSLKK